MTFWKRWYRKLTALFAPRELPPAMAPNAPYREPPRLGAEAPEARVDGRESKVEARVIVDERVRQVDEKLREAEERLRVADEDLDRALRHLPAPYRPLGRAAQVTARSIGRSGARVDGTSLMLGLGIGGLVGYALYLASRGSATDRSPSAVPTVRAWFQVLGVAAEASLDEVERAYHELLRVRCLDRDADRARRAEIERAYATARRERA